jgi:uncharacterized protein
MQTMYERVIPPMLRVFEVLRVYVEMAELFASRGGFDPGELMLATSASGMSSLVHHVQQAGDRAMNGIARLTGDCVPSFEDNEKTLDDLKARIDRTVAYLLTVDMKSFHDGDACSIERQPRDASEISMNDYCVSSVLVQEIYFHILAARQILQDHGVRVNALNDSRRVPQF